MHTMLELMLGPSEKHVLAVFVYQLCFFVYHRIKQHVPLSIRKNTIGTRIQPVRACGKVPTSIPTSCASAIGQNLIENANCAEHYNVDAFKILSRGRSITHLRILEATFIYSTDPTLCRQKEFVHSLCLFVQRRRRGTRTCFTITDGNEEDSTTALAAPPQTLQPPIGELNTEQAPPTSTIGR